MQVQGRVVSTPKSIARREKILEATLRVVAREGMRGVRHRAIAAEADVPLAATTYYFSDLQALINDAFQHFALSQSALVEPFRLEVMEQLTGMDTDSFTKPGVRQQLLETLTTKTTDFIIHQVTVDRESRLVEWAFKDEAQRNPTLSAAWRETYGEQGVYWRNIQEFLQLIQAQEPDLNATLLLNTLLHLEYENTQLDKPDRNAIEQLMRYQLAHALGLC